MPYYEQDQEDEGEVLSFTRGQRRRIDRLERAAFGYVDEGGVPTAGLMQSLSEMKATMESIKNVLHVGARVAWAILVVGLLNALHLYGWLDTLKSVLGMGK